jgi:hypothetical protein
VESAAKLLHREGVPGDQKVPLSLVTKTQ